MTRFVSDALRSGFASTLCGCLLGWGTVSAQEVGDIVRFQPPAGWKREAGADPTRYTKVDTSTGNWAQLGLYRPTSSKGDIARDFEDDWNELVVQPYKVAQPPRRSAVREAGEWRLLEGRGTFRHNQHPATVVLMTISDGRQRLSIVASSNNADQLSEISRFVASLEPIGAARREASTPSADGRSAAPSLAVTQFNDGWRAAETPDWVELTKDDLKVLLHHGVAYTDQTRHLDDQARVDHFWQLLVAPRFQSSAPRVRPGDSGYNRIYCGEADGQVAGTSQARYTILVITSAGGYANAVEISASSAAALWRAFPDYDHMLAMRGYNKFMVDSASLLGHWSSSSSAYLQYYYTDTGQFAGAAGTSSSDDFVFEPHNRYRQRLVAVSGQVGTQRAQTEKTAGSWQLNPWELTLTDQTGKTSVYDARFEAVRGGRILQLMNKKFSGMTYSLVRQPD